MKNIFIIIPIDIPSGPSKGAVALANYLVDYFPVSIICLRKGSGFDAQLDTKINLIYLNKLNFISKIIKIRKIYLKSGTKNKNISISMCFSADLINIFFNKFSITYASIRGNLIKNYTYDYKFLGTILAYFHLFLTRFHQKRIAMNKSMSAQIKYFSFKKVDIINNFIDEKNLIKYKKRSLNFDGTYRFCFLGNLIERKGVEILINEAKRLKNYKFEVLIIGKGPLLSRLQKKVEKYDLKNQIKFLGSQSDPHKIVCNCHVMVLPSYSEGTSRAVLESLFLGIPCILRNIDGNKELINYKNCNGRLFNFDNELSQIMIEVAKKSVKRKIYGNLLPKEFSQNFCGQQYLKIINENK